MQNLSEKYFLAANSCEGFISYFGESYLCDGAWRCYIIKGGPGTGKSSFMKYVALKASERGFKAILCPCSSDPNSLDGVIIPSLKTVLLDGTAPHIVEPKFAGVCEEIINLGEFWDNKKLHENSQQIIAVSKENKAFHKTASRYLAACGEILKDNLKLARGFTNTHRVEAFAHKIAQRYIPQKSGKEQPFEFTRFLTGTTPLGIVSYPKSITENQKIAVIIEDKYGAVAAEFMSTIRALALSAGYGIMTIRNPLLPSEIIDHIVIPELSIAFVSENEYISFESDVRRVHARRFSDVSAMHALRARMLFGRKISRELLLSVSKNLSHAKLIHDELEKYYIEAMDFKALTEFAQNKTKEILN